MREFGRVMAAHFDALGDQQGPASGSAAGAAAGAVAGVAQPAGGSKPLISEALPSTASTAQMGPLQAQAIERSKAATAATAATATSVQVAAPRGADGLTDEERDAARVKDIVADAELSALLLDVDMQRILQECGDPVKFRRHMADPVIAKKIKKLFDAGLVATAK